MKGTGGVHLHKSRGPSSSPILRVLAETEGWQEEGGMLLCFLLQSLEKVKGKFSSMQLQWRLETSALCVMSDRVSGRDLGKEDESGDL